MKKCIIIEREVTSLWGEISFKINLKDYYACTVQPEFRKCWDIWSIRIKLKLRLSNHMSQYFIIILLILLFYNNILFTIEHREHNKCLNWEIVHFYSLNELVSNLVPTTGLKKLRPLQQRAEKSRYFENIQLGEHLATNYINWHQVCNREAESLRRKDGQSSMSNCKGFANLLIYSA